MRRGPAPAKLNLALVVGPVEAGDHRHQVTTVFQRIDICDRVEVRPASAIVVRGFEGDTIVTRALTALAQAAGSNVAWEAHIEKQIPVAAGLGGGSSDAATALRLANETLDRPLGREALRGLAAAIGADVPFFLEAGPQLGEGDGTRLTPLDLPQDYWVVLVLPDGVSKGSTEDVYRAFDLRQGPRGYRDRRGRLLAALADTRRPSDLGSLPPNDLAASALAADLRGLGAFRADVTGAGPAVYGLFLHERSARAAGRELRSRGRTWVTVPAWYG